jgi:hypothetical protein
MEDDIPELIAKTKAFRRAEAVLEERRHALATEIGTAFLGGVRQSEIVRITGYTREHIRRIVRERMGQLEREAEARGEPWEF